jgi:glutathione S-transferase
MRLIGMLDSPYVRRVAISLELMGLDFEHQSLSVFRDFDAFAAINPVVKAPTLVAGDGVVLMESTLILDYAEALAADGRKLSGAASARLQRIVGLALVACEKTVQLVYEFELRPTERQHAPWVDRVRGQLRAALGLIEAEIGDPTVWFGGERPLQADVSTAVAWSFLQLVLPNEVAVTDYPRLHAFAQRAEALPAFLAWPQT